MRYVLAYVSNLTINKVKSMQFCIVKQLEANNQDFSILFQLGIVHIFQLFSKHTKSMLGGRHYMYALKKANLKIVM